MSAETQGPQPEGWTRVRFGDVVRHSGEKTDPEADGIERYVAGEHMDSDDLRIRRWGIVGDGYLGPAFHKRFRPGDVLYGSRRTYLRKVAVAEFDGVCANTTFVLISQSDRLLQDFLPHVMSTEAFHAYSIGKSRGSTNPYVNYSDLVDYEFVLPPLEEQKRVVQILNAIGAAVEASRLAVMAAKRSRQSVIDYVLSPRHSGVAQTNLGSICDFQTGPAFKSAVFRSATDGPVIVRGANIGPDGLRWDETFRWPKDDSGPYQDFSLKSGDVCLAMDATFTADGRMRKGVVTASHLPAVVNQRVARLRPNSTCPTELIEAVLDSRVAALHLTNKQTGAFAPHISGRDIQSVPVALPPDTEREQFLTVLRNFDALVEGLAVRLRDLLSLRISLRDSLLGDTNVH